MKKPSNNRKCTVCPKNKKPYQDDDDSNLVKPNQPTKNRRFHRPVRTTVHSLRRGTPTRLEQRKRASQLAVQKRANIRKMMNQKRAAQQHSNRKPVPNHRPLAIRSANHYFGIDCHTDVPRPQLGDTFCNTLTGQLYLYNKNIWNLIPSPSPRAYYGPSTNNIDQIVINPQEGDLFLADATDEISIYQNGHWNTRKILNQQTSSQDQSASLQLPNTNSNSSLPGNSSSSFVNSDNNNNLIEHSFVLDQVDGQLTAKYYNISESQFKNLTPSMTSDQLVELPVSPQGIIKLTLKLSEPNQISVEFGLQTWIRYSDAKKNLWQTVTCLTNLEILDQAGQPTREYVLDSPEGHQAELVNLDTKISSSSCSADDDQTSSKTLTRTLTTLASKDRVTLTTDVSISEINCDLKLLAYPLQSDNKEQKEFYAVEFNDLNQAISLPKLLIKTSPVSIS